MAQTFKSDYDNDNDHFNYKIRPMNSSHDLNDTGNKINPTN